jgi:hypothetical protein
MVRTNCSVMRCGVSSASCRTVFFGIQHGRAVLREIAGLGVVAELAFARQRLQHIGQQFEQRGFARAVRPHEHDALAAFASKFRFS